MKQVCLQAKLREDGETQGRQTRYKRMGGGMGGTMNEELQHVILKKKKKASCSIAFCVCATLG